MRHSFVASAAMLLWAATSLAQAPPPRPTEATKADEDIARIVGNSMTSGGASAFLESLTDTIGGRITGSPGSQAAAELILKALREAGFENAHFEEYELASVWRHGRATGEVVSPVQRPLYIGSYGWVPGTPGPIEVPVADFGAPGDGHAPAPEQLRGAAVIVDQRSSGVSSNYAGARLMMARQLARAGAAAMFIVSDKPDRMVYTSAFGFYPRGPLPILSLAKEDAALLRRLLAKGPVKIRLDVDNSFASSPGRERNVVADLPGTEGGEMVLLTAHFDDWDPAQGANDNGAGVATVLEAARVLKALKIWPKNTIRFVFFSGEEQLANGSRAYVEQHKAELDKIRAMINTDSGVQQPLGLQINGRPDLEAATKKLLKPLAPLGADAISLDADFDSDHESFIVAGVPAYALLVERGDYDVRHHTIVDTFERIQPSLLGMHTAMMAVLGYQFANAQERPGRRLSPTEVVELLKRTGLEPLYRLEYPDAKP
ncbi:MAG TPA: M20/M25/M40 family metallo-hydrolase [Candidatus Angelobacter sp.]|nr:M20/M25/M40 family metallo-hydrolase [Candidatus Angelobacter sp.]